MANILLTGARAPVALEYARLFNNAHHHVFASDSIRFAPTSFSNSIKRSFLLPSPRYDGENYIAELVKIIEKEKIDLLLPSNEEIFFIARHAARFPAFCHLFCDDYLKLCSLHNKLQFQEILKGGGLNHVPSQPIGHPDDIVAAQENWGAIVLKPIFSRFGTDVLFLPPHALVNPSLLSLMGDLSFDQPTWLAQPWLKGRHFSTFSISHGGTLVALSIYEITYQASKASIYLKAINHPAIEAGVQTLTSALAFTGQMGVDFIEETDSHAIYPIECNPRSTSGIHLFRRQHAIAGLILNAPTPKIKTQPAASCLYPQAGPNIMLTLPMLIFALPQLRTWQQLRQFIGDMVAAKDTVYLVTDRVPSLMQVVFLLYLITLAQVKRLPLLKMATHDMAFNGET